MRRAHWRSNSSSLSSIQYRRPFISIGSGNRKFFVFLPAPDGAWVYVVAFCDAGSRKILGHEVESLSYKISDKDIESRGPPVNGDHGKYRGQL